MPSRGAQRIANLAADTPEARKGRREVFNLMDPNGNNVLSLAEVQKFMSDTWPEYNKQRMLIRAFNTADTDGSGLITRGEFRKFLKYVLFFDDLYDKFAEIDKNDDHRLDEAEFVKGVEALGGSKIENPPAAFKAMDQNAGGYVLFDEFSVWVARKMCVDDVADDETYADAYRGSLAAITAADGQAVRSGPWWKGRMKLKKMTSKSDPAAKEARKAMFKRLDDDGDKKIAPEEVFDAVRTMWPEFDSMDAVKSAFIAADRTGDGSISFKEIRLLLKYLIFYDDANEYFKALDTNADGRLSLKEFTKGLGMLGLKKHVSNPEAAYRAMDVVGADGVALDEFAAWLAEVKGSADDMADDARRALTSGGGSGGDGGGDIGPLMKSLGLEKYTQALVNEDITSVADLKVMEMNDLRAIGLSIGAARKVLTSAADA